MITVTSFYKFYPIKKNQLRFYQEQLIKKAKELQIRGLILIGEEGINSTICGTTEQLKLYKKFLVSLLGIVFFWKDSTCDTWNFKRFSVKIKREIISIGKLYPFLSEKNQHLSPKQWEEKFHKNTQILDVRNSYEVEIGKFQGAKDLNLNTFRDFPKKINQIKLNKNKETLIYCTGGIRCEKAIELMKNKGFKKVYQLEGGILNYLKEYPHSHFQDECFVFDHRVALDQKLEPSNQYSLCPHCGQSGDLNIFCKHCEKTCIICLKCKKQSLHYETCSKNCAYHSRAGHTCYKKYKEKALRSL